jgi:hypothetical protein
MELEKDKKEKKEKSNVTIEEEKNPGDKVKNDKIPIA